MKFLTLRRSLVTSTVILVAVAVYANLFLNRSEANVPRAPLGSFPREIGKWNGTDQTFSASILLNLGVDEYLMRRFSDGRSSIWVYIGYYRSQKEGAVPHSPRHCYPGSGWYPLKNETVTIPVDEPGRKPIRANRYVFAKGAERQCVLYWYQSRGRAIADEYMEKVYLIRDSIFRNRSDGALVRLSADSTAGSEDAAIRELERFATVISRILPQYVPD